MTTSEFDADTTSTPLGDGRYAIDLQHRWHVGGGLNGGYLLAVLGRAISAELAPSGAPDPITLSTTYVGPAAAGPAEIHVALKKPTGRIRIVTADLIQDGTTRVTTLATFSDLTGTDDDVRTTATPLHLPPREECFSNEHAPAKLREAAPLMQRFDMLFPADKIGCFQRQPSGEGRLDAWFRLKDGREPDPISLLLAVDALPPVTFDLGVLGWAPTVELTAHIRARPATGWLRLTQRTRNIAGGMFEEDCEVWDSRDRLVAQARQLALLPRRPGTRS